MSSACFVHAHVFLGKKFFPLFPNIGCEDCQTAKAENCPEHPAVIIPDRRLLSFARQTLPTNFTLAVTAQREHSLMCKKAIKTRSRFGPLLGKEVKVDNGVDPQKYLFRVSRPFMSIQPLCAQNQAVADVMLLGHGRKAIQC